MLAGVFAGLGNAVHGAASTLQKAYEKGRDITLSTSVGAVRLVSSALTSADEAFTIRSGAIDVFRIFANGNIRTSQGGGASTASVQVANAASAGRGYSSGTKLHSPAGTSSALRCNGTDRVSGDDSGDRSNGSQDTDCLIYRSDGGSPPTYELVRVKWVDFSALAAGDKVLVFES